jgi:MYXO-CTERM domain-containing protein
MVKAMTTARSHIISSLTSDTQKGRPTSVLFITDGEPSDRCPTTEVTGLRNVTVGGLKYDIKTYVIGFGTLVNRTCLNDMATRGGTALSGSIKYYVANNASDLTSAINNIVASALKKSPEVCNNKDDDCDGQTDEGLSRACYNNKCKGTETCKSGKWQGCTAPATKTETCNNKDDDCDGKIDETLTQACSYNCAGTTRSGTERCSKGKWIGCTARPTAEKCNNKDDDCDGSIDDGLSRTCYNNKCKGTETCKSGKWQGCTAAATKTETCNNTDDDCDGSIDESLTRACTYSCAGTNRSGTERCSKGKWVNCTARPTSEKCDNIDNDCDGSIDEGLTKACTDSKTKCKGTSTCAAGKWGTCKASAPPGTETCNNKDDDCDGRIDENVTRACSYNCAGKTRTGTERCSRGRWYGCTARPTSEKCDNIDNDCDGSIDENLKKACTDSQTKCKGTSTCASGKWGTCNAPAPTTETCDKKDNDCDGQVDENLTQACSRPCGNSTITGTERCSNGKWSGCTAVPKKEVCDNKDNDCDGQIDDNLSQACGKCGTQVCAAGKWGKCVEAQQNPETCNNKDDDCNGKIDDGLTRSCNYKTCQGSQTCSRGKWSACRPPVEKCDGKDNDCDGKVDENWPDKGRVCGTGLGVCYRTGKFTCKKDGSGLECNVQPGKPSTEVCDAKDNDCDGKNDENLSRACTDKCVEGKQECKEGSWTTCVANPGSKPPPEKCNNGKDDNCDGNIDEGCGCPPGSTRACGFDKGECKKGVQECIAGEWSKDCKGAVTATQEVCNGKDDDCDGEVDEDITRPCKTACGEGVQACIQGDWSTCSGGHPEPEICNGIADDCDGVVDNGATGSCGVSYGCTEGGCRPKCRNGECPGGQQCIDNICVSKDCRGVRCPNGYQCEAGKCVDLCSKTQCAPGLECLHGKCMPKNCYTYGCETGKTCVDGRCIDDICSSTSCANGQYCREGKCVNACQCQEGEVCINDQCVEDPCASKQCPAGQVCRYGACEATCTETCHGGQYCQDGKCVHDPCVNINCPIGTVCHQGRCTDKLPKEPEPPADGDLPDGGTTPDMSGGDDIQTPPETMGTDNPSNPATERSSNLDYSPGDGNGAGGPGCGCQTMQGPASGILWFLGLFAFLLLIRRRKVSLERV